MYVDTFINGRPMLAGDNARHRVDGARGLPRAVAPALTTATATNLDSCALRRPMRPQRRAATLALSPSVDCTIDRPHKNKSIAFSVLKGIDKKFDGRRLMQVM